MLPNSIKPPRKSNYWTLKPIELWCNNNSGVIRDELVRLVNRLNHHHSVTTCKYSRLKMKDVRHPDLESRRTHKLSPDVVTRFLVLWPATFSFPTHKPLMPYDCLLAIIKVQCRVPMIDSFHFSQFSIRRWILWLLRSSIILSQISNLQWKCNFALSMS